MTATQELTELISDIETTGATEIVDRLESIKFKLEHGFSRSARWCAISATTGESMLIDAETIEEAFNARASRYYSDQEPFEDLAKIGIIVPDEFLDGVDYDSHEREYFIDEMRAHGWQYRITPDNDWYMFEHVEASE